MVNVLTYQPTHKQPNSYKDCLYLEPTRIRMLNIIEILEFVIYEGIIIIFTIAIKTSSYYNNSF